MAGLPAIDEYGFAAYCCAQDGNSLAPISEGSPVLRCPACGHRTDERGEGVLGDGFDVVHRQWGLRGDLHAWQALRDRVGTAPTPQTADATRKAFVDALRQVAGVDIDETGESQVYHKDLDHGGMSGGGVSVDWWRKKGIPLVVDRAMSRRPTATNERESRPGVPRSVGRVASSIAIWALLLAIPASLIGGGSWLLYQRASGTRVDATVLTCDSSGHFRRFGSTFRTDCVAQWTIDGRPTIGNFEGGNGEADVGKSVDATVRGDTAYSRSLVLPLLLIGLGVPFLFIPGLAIRRRLERLDANNVRSS